MRRAAIHLLTVVLAGATAVAACGSTPSAGSAHTGGAAPCGWLHHTTYRHVIWIWMENRSFGQVLGPGGGATHLASYAKACGVATNYDAVSHPSLPNYVAATSGSTHGISSDCDPASCPVAGPSLFGQLDRIGAGWTSYAEDMQRACDQASYGRYAARHNPAVYYIALRRSCVKHDVAMGGTKGTFAKTLQAGGLRGFTFITPNLCDDGHDCATSTADSWLGSWLQRITDSALYRAGQTVVFVTWDEGETASNQVATVVIGPTVVSGTRSKTHFTHYSLLATTEDLLGVNRLGSATTAISMSHAFNL